MSNGPRVLIIDDDIDAALAVAAVVETEGCRVRVVHRAEEAEEAARAFQPSVALVDLVMPTIDGWSLAPRLAKACPSCKLIVVTGVLPGEGLRRSAEAGFEGYLLKPVDWELLIPWLR